MYVCMYVQYVDKPLYWFSRPLFQESLQLINMMDKLSYRPSILLCVALTEQLEKARQYKAVFAVYR